MAFAQAEGALTKEMPEVLFVCVHNAGRSQMAAGLLKLRSEGRIHVRSAGSTPVCSVPEREPERPPATEAEGRSSKHQYPRIDWSTRRGAQRTGRHQRGRLRRHEPALEFATAAP